MVPVKINFWPILCRNNNIRHVTISYEASSMFDDLTSAVISQPLPAAPMATRCDGHYSYDPMNSTLEWFLLLDNSNRSGSMEFVVPPFDLAVFFPISVNFASTTTYSGLKVTDMIPLRGGDGGFVQSSELVTHEYTKWCEKKAFISLSKIMLLSLSH